MVTNLQADPNQDQQLDFPPFGYFLRTIRRHALVATLVSLPVAGLIIAGLSLLEINYASNATVVFDPRDSSINSGYQLYPEVSQISSTYLASFQDAYFLANVGRKVGLDQLGAETYEKPAYKNLIASIIPVTLIPRSWLLEGDEYKSSVIQGMVKSRLKATVQPASFEFLLEGQGESPGEAQALTREAMDTFVEFQLRNQLKKVRDNLDTFEGYLEKERRHLEEMADIYALYDRDQASTRPLQLGNTEKKRLKNRERSLITNILDKQQEVEQTFNANVQRKLDLESELAALLTRRGSTHPEVIQKRQELKEVANSQATARLNSEVEGLTRQLLQLQARMKRAGIPIDLSLQLRNLDQEGQLFVQQLSDQVNEYRLEAENLDKQIREPDARTRFRYTLEPSFDSSPANKKILILAAGAGFGLLALTFFGTILLRELYSPIIYDIWRLQRASGLPITANISRSLLKRSSNLNAQRIQALKPHLLDTGKRRLPPEVRLLREIRKLEQSMIEPDPNGPIGLLFLGQSPHLQSFIQSSYNTFASDQKGESIVVDFNHRFPASKETPDHMLPEFLDGACKWKDIKTRKGMANLYDYIRCFASLKQPPPPIDSSVFAKLITALKDKYKLILLSGPQSDFLIESTRICQESRDCHLIVCSGSAKYEDLKTLITMAGPDKIRSIAFVNS